MCRVEEAEPWIVRRTETPRARKEWSCSECRRQIVIGETYHLLVGMTDVGWARTRWCQHCNAASEWLNVTCGGYFLGELLGELDEHWDEGYQSEPFRQLIADMRAGWNGGQVDVPHNVGDLARPILKAMVAP